MRSAYTAVLMESSPRAALVSAMRELVQLGLNRGSSGNASVRSHPERCFITPSGVPPEAMTEQAIVELDWTGRVYSGAVPSSEWLMHTAVYEQRPDVHAIVHTHSLFATSLACARREIPPFHYMVAVAGGDSIRCSGYATFGTEALAQTALRALEDRRACLLANHGLLTLGASLRSAIQLALEVESLAAQYWHVLQIGGGALLSQAEMAEVIDKFKTYGAGK